MMAAGCGASVAVEVQAGAAAVGELNCSGRPATLRCVIFFHPGLSVAVYFGPCQRPACNACVGHWFDGPFGEVAVLHNSTREGPNFAVNFRAIFVNPDS